MMAPGAIIQRDLYSPSPTKRFFLSKKHVGFQKSLPHDNLCCPSTVGSLQKKK